ncbi:hypothetical protein OS242_09810 [Tumebacillus sp. DT12]|uniref:PH domain-containing protein n=1 Tax=Tumebacillus lacus TaxID=2995335 RepID=A0ABT3X028_9BACL|nr:hypothetical protein [Tumebacillus lacus]MCX7570257.1 hypothetical protein [Tumebacillus lacus]
MKNAQTVVHNDRVEAFKKWFLSLLFVVGGAYFTNLGIAEDRLRYTVIGAITCVFFLYPLYHYTRYVVVRKPLLVLDEDGVSTEDRSLLVRWEEVEHFYFDRGRAFVRLVGKKKTGELVSFPTHSVIAIKKLSAVLRAFGVKVL